MKKSLLLCVCVLSLGALSAFTEVSSNIGNSTTWSLSGSPYIITGNVSVVGSSNPVLTIEAGVQVLFNSQASLIIGHGSNSGYAGGLIVNGTQQSPVLFSANQAPPQPGHWNSLRFNTQCLNDQLLINHATFEYGGFTNTMVEVGGGNPVFDHCLFRHSASMGLSHSSNSVSAAIQNCTFENNASYPLRWNPASVYQIGAGNSYSGNTPQRILLKAVTLTQGTTWHDPGIPYELEDNIIIQTGINPLIIQTGVDLLFREGDGLNVGHGTSVSLDGCVTAEGASFAAVNPATRWNGIRIDVYSDPCQFTGCLIQDAGPLALGGFYIRTLTNPVLLDDCDFVNIDNYAVWANENAMFQIQNCSFTTCRNTVSVYPNDMAKLKGGNHYNGNTDNRIHCQSGNISSSTSWTAQGMAVFVLGNLTSFGTNTPETVIPYGTILEFNAGTSMAIGHSSSSSYRASLRAIGTTFRGAQSTPGYWTGLIFSAETNPSLLSGCVVRDAGYNNAAAINIVTQTCTVTGSWIYNNQALGINLGNNSYASLSGNLITLCGSYPLSLVANAVRVLGEGNYFSSNGVDRIEVRANTIESSGVWRDPGVPYYFTGSVSIYSPSPFAHIKIMPGTEILLPNGAAINVGYSSSATYQGSLEAEGTLFTRASESAVPAGIVFNSFCVDALCAFTNCSFSYLQNASQNTAIYVNNSDPSFQGCLFTNNPGSGILAANSARPTVNDCSFTNNGYYPIRTIASAFDVVSGVGNSFSGNNPDRILMSGGTLNQNYVWNNPSIPVEVSTDIQVYGTEHPVLRINSGLNLLFQSNTGLSIGYSSSSTYTGGLIAEGATFSALTGTTGGWDGLSFVRYINPVSYLRGCVIQFAGSDGNLRINNSPLTLVENCVIRWGTYGIRASGTQVQTSIIRNYILSNETGIHLSSGANPTIGGNLADANSISGNDLYGVQNTFSTVVNAEWNWWGDPSGPNLRYGDGVTAYVDYDPFRTTDIGDAPARFLLLSPQDLELVSDPDPVLDWEEAIDPSPGDTVLYNLQICLSASFDTDVISYIDLESTVFHIPEGVLADNCRYYWRVSATDTQSQTTWSLQPYLRFDLAIPEDPGEFQLLEPVHLQNVYVTSPLLSWQPSLDPDPGDQISYTVHLSLTAGFEDEEILSTSQTSIFSGFCQPGQIYYWKVKAQDQTGRYCFSETWRFFVDPEATPRAPASFTLISTGDDILIEWDAVPGADCYDIWFCDTPYGTFSLLDSVSNPSFQHVGAALLSHCFYQVVAHDTQ